MTESNTEAVSYGPMDKCRAVLRVWSEQGTGTQVCKELGISWGLFSQWQDTAMEGMLSALEPTGQDTDRGPALSGRLKKLLEKKLAEREGRCPRLSRRLARVQTGEAAAGR